MYAWYAKCLDVPASSPPVVQRWRCQSVRDAKAACVAGMGSCGLGTLSSGFAIAEPASSSRRARRPRSMLVLENRVPSFFHAQHGILTNPHAPADAARAGTHGVSSSAWFPIKNAPGGIKLGLLTSSCGSTSSARRSVSAYVLHDLRARASKPKPWNPCK